MNRQVMCLFLGALMLYVAGSASASLLGRWPLDGDANDVSGNGLHGTIMLADPNTDPNFVEVEGTGGQALDLRGRNDYMSITGYKGILGPKPFSIAAWINRRGNGTMMAWGLNAGGVTRVDFRINGNRLRCESSGNVQGDTTLPVDEWIHVAVTVTENAIINDPDVLLYLNGVVDNRTSTGAGASLLMEAGSDVTIGRRHTSGRFFDGVLDEVQLFSRELTAEQVVESMNGMIPIWPDAGNLSPENGAVIEDTATTLSWSAGDNADTHSVYFGTTPDLGPDQLVSQQTETGYVAADLAEDQIYYWRIDEIDSAPDANDIVSAGEILSFFVPPVAAYDHSPADGQINVITGLSWTGGWSPLMHAVYLSTDAGSITSGAVEPTILIRGGTSLDTESLEPGTTYYWAVDEFYGTHWSLGSVVSFTTAPDLAADPNADPSLVARWMFDEGEGATALDSSGNNYHALLVGDVNRVSSGAEDGGEALEFTDVSQYGAIKDLMYETTGIPEVSVFAWIRTANSGDQYILSYDRNEYYRLEINGSGGGPGQVGWDVFTDAGQSDYGSDKRVDDDEWHHVAGVFDNGVSTIYIDGVPEPSSTTGTTMGTGTRRFGLIAANSEATTFDGSNSGGPPISFLDDLRIYDRAFSASEMRNMFTNVNQALNPDPADGATVLPGLVGLTFTPGEGAVSHNVYIAMDDFAAVDAGDAAAFIGNQVAPAILLGLGIPPDPFVGGLTAGSTYYWRIDEVAADGSVTPGKVWSFTLSQ